MYVPATQTSGEGHTMVAGYPLHAMYASAMPCLQPTTNVAEAVLGLAWCAAAIKGCASQSEPCRCRTDRSSTLAHHQAVTSLVSFTQLITCAEHISDVHGFHGSLLGVAHAAFDSSTICTVNVLPAQHMRGGPLLWPTTALRFSS
jgi:hypothetical protein